MQKKHKKKGFWKDFKEFVSRGNVIGLATAIIIGGAFGKIVTSLVNDIIMPLISLATGGISISNWKWVITPANESAGITESALYYGSFIQTILDFLIISFFIFLAVRIAQKSKNKLEQITQEIKNKIIKKDKEGEIIEEIQEVSLIKEPIIQEQSSEQNKLLVNSIERISKITKSSYKSQEKLLMEIRDLLKK